jgi:hypothetical protein
MKIDVFRLIDVLIMVKFQEGQGSANGFLFCLKSAAAVAGEGEEGGGAQCIFWLILVHFSIKLKIDLN